MLKAQVVLSATSSELAELVIEENASLVETQTDVPGQRPVVITGDQVRVLDASKPTMSARVTGNLAHVEGRGMSMSGPNIHLNCGTNQLLIQGPGRMELPLDRDFQGRLLSRPGVSPGVPSSPGVSSGGPGGPGVSPADPLPLVIVWQREMKLEGSTARFVESVVASTPGQRIETEQLDVVFAESFRLADMKSQSRPKPKRIACPGEVRIRSWESDGGQQTSLQRMRMTTLDVNLESGAIHGDGPAHATTVRRQLPATAAAVPGGAAAKPPAGPAPPRPAAKPPKPLVCLDVQGQGPVTGNLYDRAIAFQEQVRAIYLPTDAWETVPGTDDPDQLGPEAIVLHSQRVEAAETPRRPAACGVGTFGRPATRRSKGRPRRGRRSSPSRNPHELRRKQGIAGPRRRAVVRRGPLAAEASRRSPRGNPGGTHPLLAEDGQGERLAADVKSQRRAAAGAGCASRRRGEALALSLTPPAASGRGLRPGP